MTVLTTPTEINLNQFGDRTLPLVVELVSSVDAGVWLRSNKEWVDTQLLHHGAILFRGFGVASVEAFQAFSKAISSDFPELLEESSPRSVIEGNVMTSTDYPSEYPIQFHNEYSYSQIWPMRLYFCCLLRAATGGGTPIADSRKVLGRLPASVRGRFASHGVLYRRNYVEGLGVSWRNAFRTTDPEVVNARCRQSGIDCEWRSDGTLSTVQKTEAILRHPKTGEETWFNHGFFFNPRSLEPESLREFMLGEPEDELSTNTSYGDGTPIEPETIESIRDAYKAERVCFPWQVGDVLLIDNMLVSHAREPYSGPRRIAVAMADPFTRAEIAGLTTQSEYAR